MQVSSQPHTNPCHPTPPLVTPRRKLALGSAVRGTPWAVFSGWWAVGDEQWAVGGAQQVVGGGW